MQVINTSIYKEFFTYHRDLYTSQILWQWVSPNLVHMHWEHWSLNMVNLLTVLILFHKAWSYKSVLILFSLGSLSVTMGLYLFSEDVIKYVGMSGVIYGLAVYGGLKTFQDQKLVSMIILGYVLLQLLLGTYLNRFLHIDILLQDMVVIRDAHWYGAISGLLSYIIVRRYQDTGRTFL